MSAIPEPTVETEVLQHTVVEQLMAVIGAPDDQDVARAADNAVRALDERLRTTTA
ncbi:hypothetical protein [Streptomyces sp. NPDC092370]|uniref:hypothetical protein n=1 Tax=Streptomyces sp. NPDC092370 TaxID=3366016 RepID=UPI0037F6F8D0